MNQSSSRINAQVYYDAFVNKLLRDYWNDNPRTIAAIEHALRWIPILASRIIDIGCGLGWSTREFANHFPHASILGLDLSPRLLEVAGNLTTQDNVRYQASDFVVDAGEKAGGYDAAVLIDVYEHFPADCRNRVHRALAQLLSTDGAVILTFPTPRHQAFLRSRHPEGLQPVDEDVTHDDMLRLARDLDGELAYYREVSIWRDGDYAHAAIVRGRSRPKPGCAPHSSRVRLQSRDVRRAQIRSRLHTEILAGNLIVPLRTGRAVCVAAPSVGATTETFITNHITRLPFRICLLHGDSLAYDHQGKAVIPFPSVALRIVEPGLRRLGLAAGTPLITRGQVRFLRREKPVAVLAEYGPTGVQILPACRRAGVRLIAHFHGYDAYQREILDTCRAGYAELFAYAEAIVAVSRDMQEQLARLGAPRDKIVYIPYGVDTTVFDRAAPAEAPPWFVAVGRFVEKKAPFITLSAFAKVLPLCPEARLTMIGDGPLLGPCKHLAHAMGISSAVEFLGPQSPEAVAATMRKSRAFVQHSVRATNGDCEGTPVAILEAQAAGLPVVATRHAGIKDVVVEGQSGLLVDELDGDGMADAMRLLAEDAGLAARMGRVGRQIVLDSFSLPRAIQRLASLIEGQSDATS